MPWEPLWTGADAERAIGVAREIGEALDRLDAREVGPSIAGGAAGLALFYAALGRATGEQRWTDKALALLDEVVEQVGEAERFDPTFYGSHVGAGFAFTVLEGTLLEADEEESDIDEMVGRLVQVSPWRNYDLIHGVVGLGMYALTRLPRPSAREQVEAVIDRLLETARETPDGLSWWTDPGVVTKERREMYPEGYYDFCLAHGNAGVVGFLAGALKAGVEKARPVLESNVRWLLAHRLPGGGFPGMAGEGDEPHGTRTAWCYGDPGVAIALYAAGTALGDEKVTAIAMETALGCIDRTAEQAAVVDAGLCHGSAGVGHVFNRLAQASGDERLADLARYWLNYTLDNRREDDYAGFPSFGGYDRPEGPGYEAAPGLLEGAPGVGLALLAAATSDEPRWDRLLLLS